MKQENRLSFPCNRWILAAILVYGGISIGAYAPLHSPALFERKPGLFRIQPRIEMPLALPSGKISEKHSLLKNKIARDYRLLRTLSISA